MEHPVGASSFLKRRTRQPLYRSNDLSMNTGWNGVLCKERLDPSAAGRRRFRTRKESREAAPTTMGETPGAPREHTSTTPGGGRT